MSSLKISFFGVHDQEDIQNSVFFSLLKELCPKKIEIVPSGKEDLLLIGPYNSINLKSMIFNKLSKNKYIRKFKKTFLNFNLRLSKRNYKPVKIFLSNENFHNNLPNYDYSFYHDMGIVNDNHFRFPIWKDHIDWSHEGVVRKETFTSKRFGFFWKIENLMSSQGDDFLKKDKKVCIITSHLNEPRRSIYLKFKKHFIVDGYGPFFDEKIDHHNNSNFKIFDILKNYAFCLCPENSLFPGYYNERVPNAFLSKTLPITWADNNISNDFNSKAFVNLIDYSYDKYDRIIELLKDDSFLKTFSNQPLLLKKPNLEGERLFIKKIISNL